MDKRYLSPLELLNIATQHAYSADYLLQQIVESEDIDALTPVASMMYIAFRLIFKAYCLHDHRPIKEYKNLMELVELNSHLGIIKSGIIPIKNFIPSTSL